MPEMANFLEKTNKTRVSFAHAKMLQFTFDIFVIMKSFELRNRMFSKRQTQPTEVKTELLQWLCQLLILSDILCKQQRLKCAYFLKVL